MDAGRSRVERRVDGVAEIHMSLKEGTGPAVSGNVACLSTYLPTRLDSVEVEPPCMCGSGIAHGQNG